jgi:hypothetical protein
MDIEPGQNFDIRASHDSRSRKNGRANWWLDFLMWKSSFWILQLRRWTVETVNLSWAGIASFVVEMLVCQSDWKEKASVVLRDGTAQLLFFCNVVSWTEFATFNISG